MNIYDRIKLKAKEKKVPIPQVEKDCGFKASLISKWGTSMPKADNLYTVAKYFNTTVEYFLTGEETRGGNNNQNVLTNSINESDNAVLVIDGDSKLSVQESEILEIYRSLGIRKQSSFIQYLLKLQDEE